MVRTTLLTALLLLEIKVYAQRTVTVLDMDNRLPIKDVSIKADGNRSTTTDYLGRAVIPVVFDSISFSHVRYEHEQLRFHELGDTMYLLPLEHMLPEVVVSELNPELKAMISGWAMIGAMAGAAEVQDVLIRVPFDFAGMFDRRGRRDKKHLKRAQELLKEWDEKDDETESE